MSGSEQEQVASVRYVSQGCRTVICASVVDIAASMKKHGVAKITFPGLWKHFLDLNENGLQDLLATGGRLFSLTQGAGDLLYMPCGFVWAEKISQSSDCHGIVLRGLVTSTHDSMAKKRVECIKEISSVSACTTGCAKIDEVLAFYSSST